MDVQCHLAAQRWQVGKRRHGDGDVVADARGLNNGLVGMLRDQPSAKVSNHSQLSVVSGQLLSETSLLTTEQLTTAH